MDGLIALIGVIISLSVASERLVEIIKNCIPQLNKENPDEKIEGYRRALLQALAVLAGMVTALLAKDYLPPEIAKSSSNWNIIGLGLLASGGSGFWNSILTYVTKVKDIKTVEAKAAVRAASE
ncbi:MAG: hypothetical protein ACKO96_45785 [Flammeovirgaceae bacterium]